LEGGAVRIAQPTDVPAITAAVNSAFFDDPLWSWAFPDPDRRRQQFQIWWQIFIRSALRYPWLMVTEHCESVTVWIPPGGVELTTQEEAQVAPTVVALLGTDSNRALAAIEELDGAHPRDEPHFYLSIFATHGEHRGQGLGMGLLRKALERIDQHAMPAYLESSNAANHARYESVGFQPLRQFSAMPGGPTVQTMWRAATDR
jgi:GNAT superfamily N-acetyltransferase